MLRLTFSNRFVSLSDRLLDDLSGQPGDPMQAEQIIVPGTAIRRRLEMDWAHRHGICANVEFGYLAHWVWQQLGRLVTVGGTSPFSPDRLVWRIYQVFGDSSFSNNHPRLAHYLAQSGQDPLMRFDLAQRVAKLFDHYITYRQEWVKAWAAGEPVILASQDSAVRDDQHWQAALWRQLLNSLGVESEHPAELFFRELAERGPDAAAPAGLPSRISLFCIADIPPLYLHILTGLSRFMTVSLYVMNPCQSYWGYIVEPRRMARLRSSGDLDYHEVGNRLLAAWGRQTQSFLALLNDQTDIEGIDDEAFEPAVTGTLLATLQNAILDMTDPEPASITPDATDRSIECHVCHSLTRELEVLHDQLLELFERHPDLTPADILVVMPGLEQSAVEVEAVFGTVPASRRIPFAITGLPRATANPAASALLSLLDLLPSRFRASEVFAWLRRPLVSTRYGLTAEALEDIHLWMREAGICWGLDADHRDRLAMPATAAHTWQDGLDRLFLGYAIAGQSEPLDGRLPAGGIEGTAALALGAFDRAMTALQQASQAASMPAAIPVWRSRLLGWLDDFISADRDSFEDLAEVRRTVNGLCDQLEAMDMAEILPLAVIHKALAERLEDPAHGALPGGMVTFAGISPMRFLPYRVIAMLGLNAGAFPGISRPDEFDLMAQSPRWGDRQRGLDDRNLFLDLLLAAGDRLHLSYTGFSIRDNSALTPSIVLTELLDYLDRITGTGQRPWVVRHPLQAFSRRYFEQGGESDSRLFSYVSDYAEALQGTPASSASSAASTGSSLAGQPEAEWDEAGNGDGDNDGDNDAAREPLKPFFTEPLPWPEDDTRQIDLNDLRRFFANPCKFLLERRLLISLPSVEDELADDEPFLPAFGSYRQLGERLLSPALAGASPDDLLTLARAGQEYPPGAVGEVLLNDEIQRISGFARTLRAARRETVAPPLTGHLQLPVEGEIWTLNGTLNELRPGGLLRARYDSLGAGERLGWWIDHLFLNALKPDNIVLGTFCMTRDSEFTFQPCPDARAHLAGLVRLFREGMTRPLPFYPKTAWAWVEAVATQPEKAQSLARKAWEPNHNGYGESTRPAYQLALRGFDQPLDGEFRANAETVFGPLLAHTVSVQVMRETADD